MTTTAAHTWRIADGFGLNAPTHRTGTADSHSDAWLQALRAGRSALLAGEIKDLTVVVDDDPWSSALISAGRDEDGHLDPAEVTATLVEIHQQATVGEVIEHLIAIGRQRNQSVQS